jgi:ribosomal protein L40E
MRESQSMIPGIDRNVYLVLDDYGRMGCAWRETNVEDTDFDAVIDDLLEGQYSNPVRVIGFNLSEGWVRDVSKEIARSCASAAPMRAANCRIRFISSSSRRPGLRPCATRL